MYSKAYAVCCHPLLLYHLYVSQYFKQRLIPGREEEEEQEEEGLSALL